MPAPIDQFCAGHGVINDHDPAGGTLLLTVLNKVSGTGYHELFACGAPHCSTCEAAT